MSGLVNVLYLTGSFFMLEVYDRVIPARSIPTLVGLGALALTLYLFQGAIEAIRSRVLARVGCALDERISGRVFDVVVRAPLKGGSAGDGLLPMRDLDQVRGFLSGLGPTALFDLPWMPIYLGVCFLFHPLIGLAALVGAVVLAGLTLATDLLTRVPQREATAQGARRNELAESGGATPRCSPPWACRSASPGNGRRPTGTACASSAGSRTWPAGSGRSRRCSA